MKRLLAVGAIAALASAGTLVAGDNVGKAVYIGTTSLSAPISEEASAPEVGQEYMEGPQTNMSFQKFIDGAVSLARLPSKAVPTPRGVNPVGPNDTFGFNGLRHKNQRIDVDGGNQFSLEPPDQGFAVGDCLAADCGTLTTYVLDSVNNAISLRSSTTGAVLAWSSNTQFFFPLAGVHEIDRSKVPSTCDPNTGICDPGSYGDFISDPKIYYDPSVNRWFVTELNLAQNDQTGAFLGTSSVMIAVSSTSDPLDPFYLYEVNTTNDGTGAVPNPTHTSCPCFGDQPLIGADANAFWFTTNEFPIFVGGFNGAQIYAVDKAALVAGAAPNVQLISGGALEEGISYTVQPATIPPGGSFVASNGGTEYFLSALEFFGGIDNRVAIWAASNTSSISTTPAITLAHSIIETQVYGQPPMAQQPLITPSQFCNPNPWNQTGSFGFLQPVGCLLQLGGVLFAQPFNVHEPLIKTNDDRMQQVVYANGRLWSGLNTIVKNKSGGPTRTAVAYFIVNPSVDGSGVPSGTIRKQGYIAVNNASAMYPAVGANSSGLGAVGFSLVGTSILPSAAYAKLDDDPSHAVGPVTFAGSSTVATATGLGLLADDGFTGYQVYDSRGGRWGDYAGTATDSAGNIWVANEFIPILSRSTLANWGTFISKITP